jgi:hypothetical protein
MPAFLKNKWLWIGLILIVILVFRPVGLLGRGTKEKVCSCHATRSGHRPPRPPREGV